MPRLLLMALLPHRANRWLRPLLLGHVADGGDPLEAAAVEGLEGDADGAAPPAVDEDVPLCVLVGVVGKGGCPGLSKARGTRTFQCLILKRPAWQGTG